MSIYYDFITIREKINYNSTKIRQFLLLSFVTLVFLKSGCVETEADISSPKTHIFIR